MFYRRLLLVSILISTVCCCAQIGTFNDSPSSLSFHSSLSGTVRDTADRPIQGAHIDVRDTNTGHIVADTYTFLNGGFEITNLRRGVYEVVASAGVTEQRTRVEVDGDREVSFRLSLTSPAAGDSASVSLSEMKVPGKARRMLQKAEEAFHKARLQEAFGFVQKALGFYPDYAKALTLRGILHMQQGDTKDAQPDLEKAVELDYGDDMGFVALAALYNNEGEFDRAQKTLEHGMSLNPNSWQANMELARAQIGRKEYGAAVRSLDRAMPLAPPEITIMHLFRAQALIGLKAYGDAVTELESYLSQSPEGPNSERARTALAQLKDFTETAKK